jgi:pimeloyl-ACP methyl ester carboxylesterase
MQKRKVGIEVADRSLVGNLYTSTADKSGVLFVHGFASNRRGYAEYAAETALQVGATCLTFDMGGHGRSHIDPNGLTINDHMTDLRRAYDYLASRKEVNAKRIGVVGASYGGYLAALLSQERKVKGLVLRAPAIYPNGLELTERSDYDMESIDTFRSEIKPGDPNRALDAIANFAGSIVVVRSGLDESIHSNVIDAYAGSAQQSNVVEIPGAHHSLEGPEREIFKQIVVSFARGL